MKGISLHSVVPVRAEASEASEQGTQMLFGETCEILKPSEISHQPSDKWRYVRLDNDSQEGWVDTKMITPMTEDEYTEYRKAYQASAQVLFPMAYAVSENNNQTIPLTAGTRLPNYKEGRFEILGVGFRIDPSMVTEKPLVMNEQNLLQTVRFFLNVPYLWGGKNALGMDCSGFTQIIMSLFGKKLLRNAREQATQGEPVGSLSEAKAGDLVFFDHEDGKISHVGIIIDSERVIHCSGRVKVEKIDAKGIFSAERADKDHPKGQYTHHLVQIRRMV